MAVSEDIEIIQDESTFNKGMIISANGAAQISPGQRPG